jgi:hypothetical protein
VSRKRRRGIDLFDDPSWDSPEGLEEAADYERLTVSMFSPRIESTLAAGGIGLFGVWVASVVLFFWVLMTAVDSWLGQAWAQLGQALAHAFPG